MSHKKKSKQQASDVKRKLSRREAAALVQDVVDQLNGDKLIVGDMQIGACCNRARPIEFELKVKKKTQAESMSIKLSWSAAKVQPPKEHASTPEEIQLEMREDFREALQRKDLLLAMTLGEKALEHFPGSVLAREYGSIRSTLTAKLTADIKARLQGPAVPT